MSGTGERNSRATLTAEDVVQGRRRCRTGESVTVVAADLAVPATALAQAVRGKSWAHLDGVEAPVQRYRRAPRREYSPEDRDALKWYARRMDRAGAQATEIARCLDVNQNTIYAWLSGRR